MKFRPAAFSPSDDPLAPAHAENSGAREGSAARIAWLDSARGLGIVLVVIGHALGGMIDSPLGSGLIAFRLAFFAIYIFHMPLFLVLAGLLVGRRIERGTGAFVRGLLPTLVWPYFLWSVLQFSVIYALGSLVNRPAENYWTTLVALPWRPVSQYWFLHALFCLHLIAVVALPRIGREGLVLVGLVAKAAAAVVVLPAAAQVILTNLLWYAIGVWLTPDGLKRLAVDRSVLARAVLLPSMAALLVAMTLAGAGQYAPDVSLLRAGASEIAGLAWRAPAMAAAIAGTLAAVGIASLISAQSDSVFAALGRLTMPIFLTHVLCIAGTRIVLLRLGLVNEPGLLLAILVVAGLAGPIAMERLSRAAGLNRWLGFA